MNKMTSKKGKCESPTCKSQVNTQDKSYWRKLSSSSQGKGTWAFIDCKLSVRRHDGDVAAKQP